MSHTRNAHKYPELLPANLAWARKRCRLIAVLGLGLALLPWTRLVVAQDYNAAMSEPSDDSGAAAGRAADASFGVESIDPYTGALKVVATDLVIPSNGGLDLAVVRTYQSYAKTVPSSPERSYQKGRTVMGIGWDLHFGRLWRGNGAAAPQLAATNTNNACRVTNVTSKDNPVLEMPDGSRQLFAASNASETNFAYISASRWILRCLPTALGTAGEIAVSPEGVKYTFNFLHRVSDTPISTHVTQTNSHYAFHVTKIEHPNGTSIDIAYLPTASSFYASLNSVTHSEGHSVTFSYTNATNQNTAHLSSFQQVRPAAEGGTRTWTFNYTPAGFPPNLEYVESVVRPDQRQTSYLYVTRGPTGPNPNGVFSMRQVTGPLGGISKYTYEPKSFPRRDALTPGPLFVITKKEISRTTESVVDGTWTYTYRPATTATETRDYTDILGPSNCITYEHETVSPSKWRIGLLLSQTVAPGPGLGAPSDPPCSLTVLRRETNTWDAPAVADQDYFRPPGIADTATFAPRISAQTVTLDQTDYTTSFNNPDAFGNPTSIVETGRTTLSSGVANPATRTTTFTYFTDTAAWIINRRDDETVVDAGPTYATPTSSPVTTNYVTTRQFYTGAKVGLVSSETRGGVATQFDYFTGATNGGSLNKVTDANGAATPTVDDYTSFYSNYKRGQARTITRSIDGTPTNQQTIDREITDAGTIAWAEDGENKRTTYSYTAVNLLSGVQTARPSGEDDDITITRTLANTNDVVTRGNYREVRQYDGFGALVRTDWSDLTPGTLVQPIFRKTDYDAEGRVTRSYLPNTTAQANSERTEYDGLNRLTKITHPDATFVTFQYQADNRVRMIDERGFVTVLAYRSFGNPDERHLVRARAERDDSPGAGPEQVTYIDRNRLGQPLSITQEGVTRTYRYNSKFFMFEENHPEIAVGASVPNAIRYTHDLAGNVLTRSVGGAASTQATFVLDRLYRVDQITFVNATGNVDFDYYLNDELRMVSKAGTRWDYLYDLNNNLTQERLTLSAPTYLARVYQLDHEYDRQDSRRYVSYPSGLRLDYVPDIFGRATRIDATQSGSAVTGFATTIGYYPNGQLASITVPNGMVTTYGQDARQRPSTFVTQGTINGSLQRVVDRLYGYDSTGNVTAITDYTSGGTSKSMTYDGLNRLRTASGPWGAGSFDYYGNNNIFTKTLGGASQTFNYDASNRLASITGPSLAFGYDTYGNITSTGRPTFGNFVYDDDSLLSTVRDSSGADRIFYGYDGNRQQTQEQYADGWSTRYKVHARSGQVFYEEDVVNFSAKDNVYLNGRLVAARTRCTSSQDSDSDGINDCTESRIGLLKNNASDAGSDTDGDGLSNLAEVQAGTDVFKADTDADGLNDGYEVSRGLVALVADSNLDSDGDGLSNLTEFGMGTNPTDADTDNDGIPDNTDPQPLFNPAVLIPILQLLLE
jgi:YD repeat-containing protein